MDIFKGITQSVIIADSAEPKSIDEIRSYGLSVLPTKKGADSVRQGIQMVQFQKISVTKRSVNLIKEYRNYLWKVDNDGKILNIPEGGDDHLLDSVRYAITAIKVPHDHEQIQARQIQIHNTRRKLLTNYLE